MNKFFKNKQEFAEFKLWLAALYNGKFVQTKRKLQTSEGYCCLGVACVVLIPESKIVRSRETGLIVGGLPNMQKSAPKWLKRINEDVREKLNYGISLSCLNDSYKYSFNEIAMLLELLYIHNALD